VGRQARQCLRCLESIYTNGPMSDTAGGYLIFLLVIVGVAVQVGLIALAVLWGTSGIRRELFELRLALNEDMARRD
jgi:hypothetical protein